MFEIFREDIERDIEENKHTINKETSSFFTRKIHPPKWIPRRSCKLIRNTDRSSNNNKNKINEPIQHHHLRLSLSHELAPSPPGQRVTPTQQIFIAFTARSKTVQNRLITGQVDSFLHGEGDNKREFFFSFTRSRAREKGEAILSLRLVYNQRYIQLSRSICISFHGELGKGARA